MIIILIIRKNEVFTFCFRVDFGFCGLGILMFISPKTKYINLPGGQLFMPVAAFSSGETLCIIRNRNFRTRNYRYEEQNMSNHQY